MKLLTRPAAAQVLEEAALMSRVLAFLSPCSPLARALSEDAAAQARL